MQNDTLWSLLNNTAINYRNSGLDCLFQLVDSGKLLTVMYCLRSVTYTA